PVKRQFLQTGFPRYRSSSSESKADVKLTKGFRAPDFRGPLGDLVFVKSGFDYLLMLLHCLAGFWSLTTDPRLRGLPCGRHHPTDDACRLYLMFFLRLPT